LARKTQNEDKKNKGKNMSNTDPINKTGVNPCEHGPINKTGMNPGAHEWPGLVNG